jgi:trk system potassium uptake protein
MRPVTLRALAGITLGISAAMVMTALVAIVNGETPGPFLYPGLSLAVIDILILTVVSGERDAELTVLDSYAVVTLSWVVSCVLGAIPFVLSDPGLGFAAALFESTSGFTTTGSTVFADVEILPRSILFWRAISHWLGGMGIVVLAVGILHHVGIGGLFLMRAEAPGPDVERMSSRIAGTARILWLIYLGMTVVQSGLYMIGGLSLFDAVTHTFATLATGGFSTRNASIAAFNSPWVEWVTITFMVLSGVNFVLYAHLARGNIRRVTADSELKAFLGFYVAAVTIVFLALLGTYTDVAWNDNLRDAAFQVATLFTSTGFATRDYVLWPGLARGILLITLFLGGSAGSTSGGIKVIHAVIGVKAMHREVLRARHRNGVFAVFVNKAALSERVVQSALVFVLLYVLTVLLSTVVVAAANTSLETALTASLAAIGNIGPGFDAVGPTRNFGFLPGWTKVWLSAVMILGRLELVTVLAFLPILDRHRAFLHPRRS